MDKQFIDAYMANKHEIESIFSKKHPDNYAEIVREVISAIKKGIDREYESPDPERIIEIDHGSYQGTLVYVVGFGGYQPYEYAYVRVYYGSCSGCDTLESIKGYDGEPPTKEQTDQYMTLALHIAQGLRRMSGDAV